MKWKCDFCDEEAVVISGYKRCKAHAKEQDRIAIHLMILDVFPSIPVTKIHELCSEMFGTEDYGFSSFPALSNISYDLKRGPIDRTGWYTKSQSRYLSEAFEKFLRKKHPEFYKQIKASKIERFY